MYLYYTKDAASPTANEWKHACQYRGGRKRVLLPQQTAKEIILAKLKDYDVEVDLFAAKAINTMQRPRLFRLSTYREAGSNEHEVPWCGEPWWDVPRPFESCAAFGVVDEGRTVLDPFAIVLGKFGDYVIETTIFEKGSQLYWWNTRTSLHALRGMQAKILLESGMQTVSLGVLLCSAIHTSWKS